MGRARTDVFLSVRKTEKPLFLPLQLSLLLVLSLITSCTINIDDQTSLPLSPALLHSVSPSTFVLQAGLVLIRSRFDEKPSLWKAMHNPSKHLLGTHT